MNYCFDCEEIFDTSNEFCIKCGKKAAQLFESKQEEFNDKSKNYLINNDLPSSIKFNSVNVNDFYKKDISGLQAYFKEMTNMERVFFELTRAIRYGCSVKQYLRQSNLMKDEKMMSAVKKGFIDVSSFLNHMLKLAATSFAQNENPELRKDYNACNEAIEILNKNSPDPYESPYDIAHHNINTLYEKEYLFLRSTMGEIMRGNLKNEEMILKYILIEYKNNDLSKMYVKANIYAQIIKYFTEFLKNFPEPDKENMLVYIGIIDLRYIAGRCCELLQNLSLLKLSHQKK